MQTNYEVIDKETGETFPVTKIEFFSKELKRVDVSFSDETVTFSNEGGALHNEFFAIREVDTHTQTDGTEHVDNHGNDIA